MSRWIYGLFILSALAACQHKMTAQEISNLQASAQEQYGQNQAAYEARAQHLNELKVSTQQVCTKSFSDPALKPVRSKLPMNLEPASFEMKSNPNKPTKQDRTAIIAYEKDTANCWAAIYQFNPREISSTQITYLKSYNAKYDDILVPLATGEISYAEYFRRLSAFDEGVQNEQNKQASIAQERQRQTSLALMQIQQQRESTSLLAGAMMYRPTVTCTHYGDSVTCH